MTTCQLPGLRTGNRGIGVDLTGQQANSAYLEARREINQALDSLLGQQADRATPGPKPAKTPTPTVVVSESKRPITERIEAPPPPPSSPNAPPAKPKVGDVYTLRIVLPDPERRARRDPQREDSARGPWPEAEYLRRVLLPEMEAGSGSTKPAQITSFSPECIDGR